jgi:predicted nucleotidyltransferase
MLQDYPQYIDWLRCDINNYFANRPDVKVCIFGSSIRQNRFNDVDVGLLGAITDTDLTNLKEHFEQSNYPYKVDIVNISTAKQSFQDNVLLNNPVLWIKP